MRDSLGALENQEEQTRSSHQVTLLYEMNGVAGDALDLQRGRLLKEATAELQRPCHEHLQEYQQGTRRHLSEVQ